MASRKPARAAAAQPSPVTTPQAQSTAAAMEPRPFALAVSLALAASLVVTAGWSSAAHAQAAEGQTGNAPTAQAQADDVRQYDIPPGPLAEVLTRFSTESGIFLGGATDLAEGKTSPGLQGQYSVEQALRTLLADSGLSYRFAGETRVTLVAAQEGDGPLRTGPITVEGQGQYTEAQDPVQGYRAEASETLTRGALPLKELPNTVNVVTEDSLEDRFARTSFDAVETVPNVVRSFDNFGVEVFNIRGFGSGSLSLNTSDGLLATNQSPLDPALIERYEVLKGPASIVSGAQFSSGGIVNRVTKRAEFDTYASFDGTLGSRDFRRVVADGNAALFDTPGVAGRLILAYEDGDGFVDRTEMERLAVSPSLSAELLDGDARFTLTGRIQREDGLRSRGVPLLSDGSLPDVDRDIGVFGDGGFFERETDEVFAEWDQDFLDNLKFNAKIGYQRSEVDRQDVFASQSGGADLDGTTTIAALGIGLETEIYAGDASVGYTHSLWGRDQEILVGVNALRRESSLRFGQTNVGSDNLFNPTANLAFVAVETPFSNKFFEKQIGTFAQVTVRPIEGLTLVAAGRYDDYEAEVSGLSTTDDQTSFTGRLGASYAVTTWATVYGSFAESFQPQFTFDRNGAPLPPETGEQFEGGVKFDLLENKLSLTAAVFQIERQNVARSVQGPDGSFFSETVGEQRHRGFELDVTGEVLPGLTLSGGYGYIDAEITEDPNPLRQGNRPQHVAEHTGSLTLRYDFQSGPLQGVHLGGVVNAVGSRFLDDQEQTKIDGYVRGDLFAGYQVTDSLEARVFVRNLTNAQYIETPGSISNNNHFNEPLSVYFTLGAKF